MKDLKDIPHFEPSEKIVDILMKKTQNNNPLFFRVLVAYYFSKIASMMRCNIQTHDRGEIPVSMYAINLSVSGSGKGYSTNIMEDQVIHLFKRRFLDSTFPDISKKNIDLLTEQRAIKHPDLTYEDVREKVQAEFEQLGPLVFGFDSATTPAVKQIRQKILMSKAGSINLEIDEIGSNLLGNAEVLNTFLELFDVGKVKNKLLKNTNDNKRIEEIDGRTPANMLLFGTPVKLFNGSKTEDECYSMLETGYARRCLFGYTRSIDHNLNLTPEELYEISTDTSINDYLTKFSRYLSNLADEINFSKLLQMTKDVSLIFIGYKLKCDKIASKLKEHEELQKSELSHRYYKATKLAGTFAFIDGAIEIEEQHAYQAIKLVEESGEAFEKMLTRDRNYVRLARYIAEVGTEVTQVDLVEDLPFYKGGDAQKKELMKLAIAYGYKNNIVITTSISDGIEFFKGESLKETNLDQMIVAYSQNITENFLGQEAPFDKLHKLVTSPGYHYTAHHFKEGYRNKKNAIPGCNLVILDVDEGVTLKTAQLLLKDYKALFATTKRHTDQHNRFRILLPLSHTVKLNCEQYQKFMENVFAWLPFEVDDQTKDCSRKWESFNGTHVYQDGELLDAMLFIPQTKKEEEQAKKILDTQALSNLERWFVLNTSTGNRSNQLIKYAYVLVDNGLTVEQIRNSMHAFNDKISNKLPVSEIDNTIMVSVVKAVTKRDSV